MRLHGPMNASWFADKISSGLLGVAFPKRAHRSVTSWLGEPFRTSLTLKMTASEDEVSPDMLRTAVATTMASDASIISKFDRRNVPGLKEQAKALEHANRTIDVNANMRMIITPPLFEGRLNCEGEYV